ncbi:MAG: cell division protein ZipA [Wenzhouxiangella sp.]|nr:cell division protein ZipA [Wenzhouxiangella sp.]MCH8478121.1 cell division protein ZipA [Wenzhouxiangella sp.]
MDNLRLILIVLGIIVLAGIVLFHKPAGQSQRNHARWLTARREPRLGDLDDEQSSDSSRPARPETPASPSNLAAGLASARLVASERELDEDVGSNTGSEPRRRQVRPDKIVTLYVQRKEGRRINGTELRDSAAKAGLNFGEMNIFHRLHEGASDPVFSMANLTAPGHFDPHQWNAFDTPGVTFFTTLPAPVSALDAWDAMLATARRMAELLEAEVLDDNRCLVTRQRIAQMREEMRDYDRTHGL